MKLIASFFVVGSFLCVACGTSFTTSQDPSDDGAGGDENSTGGTSSGGSSSGGDSATGGTASVGDSASGGDSSCEIGLPSCDAVACDPALITCQPIVPPPPCPEGQVYSVTDGCHGECVDIDRCDCSDGAACPDPDHYVCHNYRRRCGYYVR